MKIITWVDLEGRYRVTSPAYGDRANPPGETEDETIERVLVKIRKHYGLPDTHVFHLVEDADQRARVAECCGTCFRYGVFDTDARAGAWEMDTDGCPKVNMSKARPIKTDQIRVERNARLAAEDIAYMIAEEQKNDAEKLRVATKKQALRDLPATIQSDLDALTTPENLEAYAPVWPTEEN